MNLPWAKLAGVSASVTAFTTAICTLVAPDSAVMVGAIVTAGFPLLAGAAWTWATIHIAVVGRDNTRWDEALKAIAKGLNDAKP